MVAVRSLRFAYNRNTMLSFPDFTVREGEHCLLLGQSGSGKTTLLHVLGGLLRKYSGSAVVAGQEWSAMSEAQADRFRGRRVGLIFQRNHLVQALTVEKNLLLPLWLSGASPDAARVDDVLSRLGLADKKKSAVNELSQGQAQRVAIARAVMARPGVLLVDEPTSALDDLNCERVIRLLMDVARENKSTLVVATHDQRLKDVVPARVELVTASPETSGTA